VRLRGGPGTHNGMKSVIFDVGSEDFVRVRIGIGAVPPNTDIIDFVLGKPQGEDHDLLQAACKRAAEAVDAIVRLGAEQAMQRFNKG
jgi:PTH1 family peptidyl-tRNA hydrolase